VKILRYILKDLRPKETDKNKTRRILALILSEDITARDYDERIEVLGIEHAIRTYWERRIQQINGGLMLSRML